MSGQGWQCPNCGKAHAPSVQTCPEPANCWPSTLAPGLGTVPTYSVPGWLYPVTTCQNVGGVS